MTDRQEKRAAAVLIAAAFLLFNLYSIVTPLFEASDELWHYPFVQHLVAGGGLPIQRAGQTDADAPWRQEGSQPPLYYVLAALVSAPFDHSNWRELRRVNPHADMGVPTRDGNSNAILHTPAERWPWTGAALAVRIARLASILMSTATVAFAYLIARELFRREEAVIGRPSSDVSAWLRLSVILFTACVPMFAFIGSVLNNDNAAVLFSTVGLWWALRLMRRQNLSLRSAIIAGLIAGLGALSKTSAVGLIGLFGLAALLAGFRDPNAHLKLSRRVLWVAVMLACTAVVAGWWYVRNVVLYGDVLGWNAFLDVVGRRDVPATLAQLWTEREGFVWAYWGVFGTLNLIMPEWVYVALNLTVLAAAVGWGWQLICVVRRRCRISPAAWRATLLCGVWVLVLFVSFLRWTSLTPASQGRLLFPCIAVIAAFTAYGLWRIHRLVLGAACALLMGVAVAVPFAVIAPAYAQPASTWTQRLSEPINAVFADGALELVEGQSDAATSIFLGDEVTLRLNWRLNAPLPKNYSVFVHLVDEHDVIVAQRDMYPGQGNLATSELAAGYQWSDHYTLRISALELAPKRLRWRVGVYDAQTGERLTLPDSRDFAEFGALTLQRPSTTNPLLRYSNGAVLTRYEVWPGTLTAGQNLTVTLDWSPDQVTDAGDYAFSVQVLDEGANKIGSHDGPLSAGSASYAIPINLDAKPGIYRLLVVVYRAGDFARVSAYDARGQFVGDQISLTHLRLN